MLVRGWHLAVLVGVLMVPLSIWLGLSLADGGTMAAGTASPDSERATRPALPTRITVSPYTPPRTATTRTVRPAPTRTTRPAMTDPPTLVTPRSIPLAPIPTAAKTVRFEVYVVGGGNLEVSFYDTIHDRYTFPTAKGSLAFNVPAQSPSAGTSPYYSLSARAAPGPGGPTQRPDVVCRVLVDGVLVSSEQGRGSASCYLRPGIVVRRT